ncbi:hypothetical protein CSUI_008024 [Cystoisospora suis]|uniref:Vps41 beta-propeller domain-containing protein n=1 Tax=Cystoisospora suis TaxID=483139 RepID=A0A2C6JRB0_9APIC|nr:hypothetical protein CSUI_008024 [Cystoisospora suis]
MEEESRTPPWSSSDFVVVAAGGDDDESAAQREKDEERTREVDEKKKVEEGERKETGEEKICRRDLGASHDRCFSKSHDEEEENERVSSHMEESRKEEEKKNEKMEDVAPVYHQSSCEQGKEETAINLSEKNLMRVTPLMRREEVKEMSRAVNEMTDTESIPSALPAVISSSPVSSSLSEGQHHDGVSLDRDEGSSEGGLSSSCHLQDGVAGDKGREREEMSPSSHEEDHRSGGCEKESSFSPVVEERKEGPGENDGGEDRGQMAVVVKDEGLLGSIRKEEEEERREEQKKEQVVVVGGEEGKADEEEKGDVVMIEDEKRGENAAMREIESSKKDDDGGKEEECGWVLADWEMQMEKGREEEEEEKREKKREEESEEGIVVEEEDELREKGEEATGVESQEKKGDDEEGEVREPLLVNADDSDFDNRFSPSQGRDATREDNTRSLDEKAEEEHDEEERKKTTMTEEEAASSSREQIRRDTTHQTDPRESIDEHRCDVDDALAAGPAVSQRREAPQQEGAEKEKNNSMIEERNEEEGGKEQKVKSFSSPREEEENEHSHDGDDDESDHENSREEEEEEGGNEEDDEEEEEEDDIDGFLDSYTSSLSSFSSSYPFSPFFHQMNGRQDRRDSLSSRTAPSLTFSPLFFPNEEDLKVDNPTRLSTFLSHLWDSSPSPSFSTSYSLINSALHDSTVNPSLHPNSEISSSSSPAEVSSSSSSSHEFFPTFQAQAPSLHILRTLRLLDRRLQREKHHLLHLKTIDKSSATSSLSSPSVREDEGQGRVGVDPTVSSSKISSEEGDFTCQRRDGELQNRRTTGDSLNKGHNTSPRGEGKEVSSSSPSPSLSSSSSARSSQRALFLASKGEGRELVVTDDGLREENKERHQMRGEMNRESGGDGGSKEDEGSLACMRGALLTSETDDSSCDRQKEDSNVKKVGMEEKKGEESSMDDNKKISDLPRDEKLSSPLSLDSGRSLRISACAFIPSPSGLYAGEGSDHLRAEKENLSGYRAVLGSAEGSLLLFDCSRLINKRSLPFSSIGRRRHVRGTRVNENETCVTSGHPSVHATSDDHGINTGTSQSPSRVSPGRSIFSSSSSCCPSNGVEDSDEETESEDADRERHPFISSPSSCFSSSSFSSCSSPSFPPLHLRGHTDEISCISSDKAGYHVASCAIDGRVLVHQIPFILVLTARKLPSSKSRVLASSSNSPPDSANPNDPSFLYSSSSSSSCTYPRDIGEKASVPSSRSTPSSCTPGCRESSGAPPHGLHSYRSSPSILFTHEHMRKGNRVDCRASSENEHSSSSEGSKGSRRRRAGEKEGRKERKGEAVHSNEHSDMSKDSSHISSSSSSSSSASCNSSASSSSSRRPFKRSATYSATTATYFTSNLLGTTSASPAAVSVGIKPVSGRRRSSQGLPSKSDGSSNSSSSIRKFNGREKNCEGGEGRREGEREDGDEGDVYVRNEFSSSYVPERRSDTSSSYVYGMDAGDHDKARWMEKKRGDGGSFLRDCFTVLSHSDDDEEDDGDTLARMRDTSEEGVEEERSRRSTEGRREGCEKKRRFRKRDTSQDQLQDLLSIPPLWSVVFPQPLFSIAIDPCFYVCTPQPQTIHLLLSPSLHSPSLLVRSSNPLPKHLPLWFQNSPVSSSSSSCRRPPLSSHLSQQQRRDIGLEQEGEGMREERRSEEGNEERRKPDLFRGSQVHERKEDGVSVRSSIHHDEDLSTFTTRKEEGRDAPDSLSNNSRSSRRTPRKTHEQGEEYLYRPTPTVGTSTSSSSPMIHPSHFSCSSSYPQQHVHQPQCLIFGSLDGRLILHRHGYFYTSNHLIHSGEGAITCISWRNSLLAWSNQLGVKILDVDTQQKVSFIPNTSPSLSSSSSSSSSATRGEKCQLEWAADDVLCICWRHLIRIVCIRSKDLLGVVDSDLHPHTLSSSLASPGAQQLQGSLSSNQQASRTRIPGRESDTLRPSHPSSSLHLSQSHIHHRDLSSSGKKNEGMQREASLWPYQHQKPPSHQGNQELHLSSGQLLHAVGGGTSQAGTGRYEGIANRSSLLTSSSQTKKSASSLKYAEVIFSLDFFSGSPPLSPLSGILVFKVKHAACLLQDGDDAAEKSREKKEKQQQQERRRGGESMDHHTDGKKTKGPLLLAALSLSPSLSSSSSSVLDVFLIGRDGEIKSEEKLRLSSPPAYDENKFPISQKLGPSSSISHASLSSFNHNDPSKKTAFLLNSTREHSSSHSQVKGENPFVQERGGEEQKIKEEEEEKVCVSSFLPWNLEAKGVGGLLTRESLFWLIRPRDDEDQALSLLSRACDSPGRLVEFLQTASRVSPSFLLHMCHASILSNLLSKGHPLVAASLVPVLSKHLLQDDVDKKKEEKKERKAYERKSREDVSIINTNWWVSLILMFHSFKALPYLLFFFPLPSLTDSSSSPHLLSSSALAQTSTPGQRGDEDKEEDAQETASSCVSPRVYELFLTLLAFCPSSSSFSSKLMAWKDTKDRQRESSEKKKSPEKQRGEETQGSHTEREKRLSSVVHTPEIETHSLSSSKGIFEEAKEPERKKHETPREGLSSTSSSLLNHHRFSSSSSYSFFVSLQNAVAFCFAVRQWGHLPASIAFRLLNRLRQFVFHLHPIEVASLSPYMRSKVLDDTQEKEDMRYTGMKEKTDSSSSSSALSLSSPITSIPSSCCALDPSLFSLIFSVISHATEKRQSGRRRSREFSSFPSEREEEENKDRQSFSPSHNRDSFESRLSRENVRTIATGEGKEEETGEKQETSSSSSPRRQSCLESSSPQRRFASPSLADNPSPDETGIIAASSASSSSSSSSHEEVKKIHRKKKKKEEEMKGSQVQYARSRLIAKYLRFPCWGICELSRSHLGCLPFTLNKEGIQTNRNKDSEDSSRKDLRKGERFFFPCASSPVYCPGCCERVLSLTYCSHVHQHQHDFSSSPSLCSNSSSSSLSPSSFFSYHSPSHRQSSCGVVLTKKARKLLLRSAAELASRLFLLRVTFDFLLLLQSPHVFPFLRVCCARVFHQGSTVHTPDLGGEGEENKEIDENEDHLSSRPCQIPSCFDARIHRQEDNDGKTQEDEKICQEGSASLVYMKKREEEKRQEKYEAEMKELQYVIEAIPSRAEELLRIDVRKGLYILTYRRERIRRTDEYDIISPSNHRQRSHGEEERVRGDQERTVEEQEEDENEEEEEEEDTLRETNDYVKGEKEGKLEKEEEIVERKSVDGTELSRTGREEKGEKRRGEEEIEESSDMKKIVKEEEEGRKVSYDSFDGRDSQEVDRKKKTKREKEQDSAQEMSIVMREGREEPQDRDKEEEEEKKAIDVRHNNDRERKRMKDVEGVEKSRFREASQRGRERNEDEGDVVTRIDFLFPVHRVVQSLKRTASASAPLYLFLYLKEIFDICPQATKDYYFLQVYLYLRFAPHLLLSFLQRADGGYDCNEVLTLIRTVSGGAPAYLSSSSNSHSSPYLQGNDHDRSAYTTALYTYILNSLHDGESSSPPLLPPLESLPSSASSLLSLSSSPGDHRLLIPTPFCSSSPTLTDPSSKQPCMLPFSSSLPPALLHCEAFLLGRLGRFSEALHILVEDLADIPAAVSLAWESSDPSVWKILVSAIVVQRPCYITEMMDSLDDHLKGTSSAYIRRNEGSWWESDDDVVFLTTNEGKRDEKREDHRHDDHPMLLLKKERGLQSSHEENRHKNFNVDRNSHHLSGASSSLSRSRRPSSSDKCQISDIGGDAFSFQPESSRSPHASVYSSSQRGETGWREEEQTMKKKGLSKETKTEEKEEDAKGDKGQDDDKEDISEGQGKRQKGEKEVDHPESEDPKTEDERRRKADALGRVATSPRKGGDNEKKRETSLRSPDFLEEEEARLTSEKSISVQPTPTIESSSHSLLPPSKSSTHEKQEDLLSSSSSSPPSISTEPRAISQIPSREDKIAQQEEEETGQVRSRRRRRREGERRGSVGEKAHNTAHSDEGGGAAAVAALLAPLHLLKSLPSHAIHLIPRLQRRLSPLFKQRQLKEDFWTAANACLEEDLKLLGHQLLLRRRRGVAICPGAASSSSSSLTGASLYQNQHYATSPWTGSNTTGRRRAGEEGEEGKRSFMMMMNRGETRGKAGEKNSMYVTGDGRGIGEGEEVRYLSFENARSKYDREKTQRLLKAVRKRIEELEREMKEEERERRRIFSEGEVRKEGETPRSSRCERRDMMRMVDGNKEMRETSVQGKQGFSAGKRGTSLFPTTEGYRVLASSDFEERILMKLSQTKQATFQKKRANTDIVLTRVSPKLNKNDNQGMLKKTEERDLSSSLTTSSPSSHPRHHTLPSSATIDGSSSLFLSLQKGSIPSSEKTSSSLEKSHLLLPSHRKNHAEVSIESTKTTPPPPSRQSGPINSNPSSLSTSVSSSSSASSSYTGTLQEHEEVQDNETEASLDGTGGEGVDERMTTHTRGSSGGREGEGKTGARLGEGSSRHRSKHQSIFRSLLSIHPGTGGGGGGASSSRESSHQQAGGLETSSSSALGLLGGPRGRAPGDVASSHCNAPGNNSNSLGETRPEVHQSVGSHSDHYGKEMNMGGMAGEGGDREGLRMNEETQGSEEMRVFEKKKKKGSGESGRGERDDNGQLREDERRSYDSRVIDNVEGMKALEVYLQSDHDYKSNKRRHEGDSSLERFFSFLLTDCVICGHAINSKPGPRLDWKCHTSGLTSDASSSSSSRRNSSACKEVMFLERNRLSSMKENIFSSSSSSCMTPSCPSSMAYLRDERGSPFRSDFHFRQLSSRWSPGRSPSAIVAFYCGHSAHRECLLAARTIAPEEEESYSTSFRHHFQQDFTSSTHHISCSSPRYNRVKTPLSSRRIGIWKGTIESTGGGRGHRDSVTPRREGESPAYLSMLTEAGGEPAGSLSDRCHGDRRSRGRLGEEKEEERGRNEEPEEGRRNAMEKDGNEDVGGGRTTGEESRRGSRSSSSGVQRSLRTTDSRMNEMKEENPSSRERKRHKQKEDEKEGDDEKKQRRLLSLSYHCPVCQQTPLTAWLTEGCIFGQQEELQMTRET